MKGFSVSFTPQQTEELTLALRQSLGDNITWKYEERFTVMLSEFAQNKSAVILEILQKSFPHQWDKKSVKQLPNELKMQLDDSAKVTNQQLIFSVPANDTMPAIVAFWWPWGHGGTYSLRIKLLKESYHFDETVVIQQGLFAKLKGLFS